MGETFSIKAGERKRVYRLFSSSIPSTINFDANADAGEITGVVEVDRWHWFSWKRETVPLKRNNAIEKGFGDADFLIHITPDQDCEVVFQSKSVGGPFLIIVLAVILIVAIASVMIALTAPPSGG